MTEHASHLGDEMPLTVTDIPGPESVALVDVLAKHESLASRLGVHERVKRSVVPIPSLGSKRSEPTFGTWMATGTWISQEPSVLPSSATVIHASKQRCRARAGKLAFIRWGMSTQNEARIRLMEKLGHMAPGDLSQCIHTSGGAEAGRSSP